MLWQLRGHRRAHSLLFSPCCNKRSHSKTGKGKKPEELSREGWKCWDTKAGNTGVSWGRDSSQKTGIVCGMGTGKGQPPALSPQQMEGLQWRLLEASWCCPCLPGDQSGPPQAEPQVPFGVLSAAFPALSCFILLFHQWRGKNHCKVHLAEGDSEPKPAWNVL